MRRCARGTFTQQQFDRYKATFWAMPRARGVPPSSPLGGLSPFGVQWKTSRGAGLGLLPLLGQYANTRTAENAYQSLEEASRLLLQAPGTLQKGASALESLGYAKRITPASSGALASSWIVNGSIAAPHDGSTRYRDYFYFPSSWIYGGHWGLLHDSERQAMLTVAAHASVRFEEPTQSHFLNRLSREDDRRDLQRCWVENAIPLEGERHHHYRIAILSAQELSRYSGLGRTSTHEVLSRWTCPDDDIHDMGWGDKNRGGFFTPAARMLIRAYELQRGMYLFHIRDHVSQWSFEELNHRLGLADVSVRAAETPHVGRAVQQPEAA
jgi:hypothetical protein